MDTDKLLLERFITNYPAQAALAVEKLTDEEIVAFMEQMPLSLNLQLIGQLTPYRGAKCLPLLRPGLAVELIENIKVPLAESLLRQCEIPFRLELLDTIDPKLAIALREKLEYKVNTVGALMTPSVFALNRSVLVGDALELIKQEIAQISSLIYVIDDEDRLEGNVMIHELFFADPGSKLYEIVQAETPKFVADLPLKSVLDDPAWHTHRSIPVIDRSEKLIGILEFAAVQMSTDKTGNEITKEALVTSTALGELYRIGLTSFLQSISK